VLRARRKRAFVRIEMRILLLGSTGAEPAFRAWSDWLARAGVPFDAIEMDGARSPVVIVDEAGNARYQATILADELAEAALEPSQRTALERLERELGVRRLAAYAYPGPEHGLTPPVWAGPLESVSATLTPSGREVFPYLREQLPIDAGSWAYLAAPAARGGFETLLAGPDRSALLGVHHDRNGREEMVQLFDANPAQTHGQLLRRGQLAWLTRGNYLGFERDYLSVQIDDVLLPNHSWDVEAHETDLSPESSIRMTAEDARRAAAWSRARGLRLDLACNGVGSERYTRQTGVAADPLLEALLEERDAFGWINHTYEHLDLSDVPQSTIETEIERNFSWASTVGLEFEPRTLITGEHTGLANLAAMPPREENIHLAAALSAQRNRYLACDASRPYPARSGRDQLASGAPFVIGTALVVPRYPMILSHDAATETQALDRLRHAGGVDGDSWKQVIEVEAKRIFATMISNDPRPHYCHQSNLIGACDGRQAPGLLYELLDAVLRRYERYMAPDAPIAQPTLAEIGKLLLNQQGWRSVLGLGSITAYTHGAQVTIVNSSSVPLEVPLTRIATGEANGANNSGWIRVMPGETVIEPKADPFRPSGGRALARS